MAVKSLQQVVSTVASTIALMWASFLAIIAVILGMSKSDRTENHDDNMRQRLLVAATSRASCFELPPGCLQRPAPSARIFRIHVAHALAAPLGHASAAEAAEEADGLLVRPILALRCRESEEAAKIRHEFFFTQQIGHQVPMLHSAEEGTKQLLAATQTWSSFNAETVPLLLAGWRICQIQCSQQLDRSISLHFGYAPPACSADDSSSNDDVCVWCPALPTVNSSDATCAAHCFTLGAEESIQLVELHEGAVGDTEGDEGSTGRFLAGVSFYTDGERSYTVGSRGAADHNQTKEQGSSSGEAPCGFISAPSGCSLVGMQGLSLLECRSEVMGSECSGLLQCCFIFGRQTPFTSDDFDTPLEVGLRSERPLRRRSSSRSQPVVVQEPTEPYSVVCEAITHPDPAQQKLITFLRDIDLQKQINNANHTSPDAAKLAQTTETSTAAELAP